MPGNARSCWALRITLSALMKWLHLFCHITFFEKMRKSYFPPTFTRIQMIRSCICDHQKRSSYQSNHNSRIAFDILSAFAIIQKEKTLISYRLRYLTIWPSFPSSLTLAMMETKFRQRATHCTLHTRNLRRKTLRHALRRKGSTNNVARVAREDNATANAVVFQWILLVLAIAFEIIIEAIINLSAIISFAIFELIQHHKQSGCIRGRNHVIGVFLLGVSPLYVAAHQNSANDAAFFEAGRFLILRHGYRRISKRKFRAYFGATSAICADIWQMINPREEISSFIKPIHLLWGLMLMKVYSTEEVLSGIAGVTEKTFQKWAWKFIKEIADLSYSLVSYVYFINSIHWATSSEHLTACFRFLLTIVLMTILEILLSSQLIVRIVLSASPDHSIDCGSQASSMAQE